MQLNESTDVNSIYRVFVSPTTNEVELLWFGIDDVDSMLRNEYASVDELPEWMQEKLALLSMVPVTKPTPIIEGVGRRIDNWTYWIFKPEGTGINGNYPREKSKTEGNSDT
jgi:hypothetical protein